MLADEYRRLIPQGTMIYLEAARRLIDGLPPIAFTEDLPGGVIHFEFDSGDVRLFWWSSGDHDDPDQRIVMIDTQAWPDDEDRYDLIMHGPGQPGREGYARTTRGIRLGGRKGPAALLDAFRWLRGMPTYD